ncbi:universal stress protein [Dactylosporangium roseum]|uniref:Universal stress protein n=1 Tax=Dactylosporangium roseum TaxID=47989 RepID=A0ABY5ZDG5_9ACTN|nr:universal stress protein [Dactylosporangium roseum]UWZ40076.1 universal stress protein [Dactylosporangium roseum]
MAYQYGPIVVGVDGSADSVGALRWAADLAHRYTRTLVAVNVLPRDLAAPPGGPDIAAEAAAEARRWRVGVAAIGSTEHGAPVRVLRRHATEARLLVVGGRGAGGGHKPLGSVSEALGVWADCPVLIVHDARRWAAPDAALPGADPVAVGFDGSDSARRALRLAFEEAAGRGSRLVVVQAWSHPDLWRPGQQHGTNLCADETAVHEALRDAAAPWCAKYPYLDVEVRGEPGDAVETLAVVSQWAALMVLGTRCPTDRVQPPNPSVMRRVLEHAACPVLVAHGPGPAAAGQTGISPASATGGGTDGG